MIASSRSRRATRQRLVAAGLAAGLAVCAAALLGGCSASMIGDRMPAAVGGLPEDAPQRPAIPAAYPAVHNMPPARSSAPLSDEQQRQLELMRSLNQQHLEQRGGRRSDGVAGGECHRSQPRCEPMSVSFHRNDRERSWRAHMFREEC